MAEFWYYGPEEERRGPLSEKEIRNLIRARMIEPDTLLCGKDGKCHPAFKTEFAPLFPDSVFPRDGDAGVSDAWAWAAAALPLAVSAALHVMYCMGKEPPTGRITLLPLLAVLLTLDHMQMTKAGYRPLKNALLWTVLFYPVYLYKKATLLRRRRTCFYASILMMLTCAVLDLSWPLLERAEIERSGRNIVNQLLDLAEPDVDEECTRAVLDRRLPGCRFEITGHLKSGGKVEMVLEQFWLYLKADPEGKITMPIEVGKAILKKEGIEFSEEDEEPAAHLEPSGNVP